MGTDKFGHRHHRNYPTIPVVDGTDPEAIVSAINNIRETMLIMLGDKHKHDTVVIFSDLEHLGLIDPTNYEPRRPRQQGLPHGRIIGVLNVTMTGGVWYPLAFGSTDLKNHRLFKSDHSGLELRVTGEYLVMLHVPIPAYSSSTNKDYAFSLRLLINGGSPTLVAKGVYHEEHDAILIMSRILSFTANDVITFEVTHDNTKALAINETYCLEVIQLDPDPPLAWAKGIRQPRDHG